MIAIIIALDVFSALPFAYLRYRLRPLRFAFLKLLNIALTIIFNLFFLVVCPVIYKNHPDLISWFWSWVYFGFQCDRFLRIVVVADS